MVKSACCFCRDSQISPQHPEVIEKQKEMNIQQTSQQREAILSLWLKTISCNSLLPCFSCSMRVAPKQFSVNYGEVRQFV